MLLPQGLNLALDLGVDTGDSYPPTANTFLVETIVSEGKDRTWSSRRQAARRCPNILARKSHNTRGQKSKSYTNQGREHHIRFVLSSQSVLRSIGR